MSQPTPTRQLAKPKPNADRYTILLLIALFAMIIGCVVLYLEISAQGLPLMQVVPVQNAPIAEMIVETMQQLVA